MSAETARIQTPYLVEEDELDRSLRPRRLSDFVGQSTLLEQLGVAIEAASAHLRGRPRRLRFNTPPWKRRTPKRLPRVRRLLPRRRHARR